MRTGALRRQVMHFESEENVREKYRKITLTLIRSGLTITTMESCTSGLIASLITDTEGSSAVLKGAFITYSNEAKILQGVDAAVIEKYGVYSTETARAMAAAAGRLYKADLALGVTGTTGNVDPENSDSVPGEVYIALETSSGTLTREIKLPPMNSRWQYKIAAADAAADMILTAICKITG